MTEWTTLTRERRARVRERAEWASGRSWLSTQFQCADVLALLDALDAAEARVAALEDAIEGAVVELACNCDDDYTSRGRHEPNDKCYVGRDLAGALEASNDR